MAGITRHSRWGRRRFLAAALVWCGMWSACADDPIRNVQLPPAPGNADVSPWSATNRVIYEVNVRNYSAAGTLRAVETDLPRLKDLGVDVLWLMPIHPIGQLNRQGTAGSPYAVSDYRAIHPDLGTPADLRSLIAAAHAAGMEVWLDWVANHTAWDHAWVREHLDYYAQRDGRRPFSPDGWADVVQLDFQNPALRQAMIDAMVYWVAEFGIDGYRCDAATFVPLDFWREARRQVDAVKPITWLAEGDDPRYLAVFDMDYAWAFNSTLNALGNPMDASKVASACHALVGNPDYVRSSRMAYLTNHDLNAFDGTEFARYGANVLPLTALYLTVSDMPLIYNGQEIGMDRALSLFEHQPITWQPANARYTNLFKRLIRLKRTQPALAGGEARAAVSRFHTDRDAQVLAYTRTRGDNEVLVVLNLSPNPVRFRWATHSPRGEFVDYLQGGTARFSVHEPVTVSAHGYAVYVKNPL